MTGEHAASSIRLRPGKLWDCPHCHTTGFIELNFLTREEDPAQLELLARQEGYLEDWQSLEDVPDTELPRWFQLPDFVQCRSCRHVTMVAGLEDEEDEEDEDEEDEEDDY